MGPSGDAVGDVIMASEKVIALIDGEHYLPVIKAALAEIRKEYDLLATVFLGGTEKIADEADLSQLECPVVIDKNPLTAIDKAITDFHPQTVIDLSDEPVVGYRERFALASLALARGVKYLGSDFYFEPPKFKKIADKPAISIIGTGKRVGKTAVSAFIGREFKAKNYRPCVVAMGRGGPAEPEVIYGDKFLIDNEYLLAAAKEGRHAASDYFEDALMARLPTVGCRRCGGGMAGAPFISNVHSGALAANDIEAEMIIFEGSGAAIPPVKTDSRVVVCGADQPLEYLVGFMGGYRLLISDLAVLTNCEKEIITTAESDKVIQAIKKVNHNLRAVKIIFRPRPLKKINGEKIFYTTTAPRWIGKRLKRYLEEHFDCQVVGISHNLSDRKRLRQDMAAGAGKFSMIVTELKAASVDVAATIGEQLGVEVVYSDNQPLSVGGDGDLASEIDMVYRLAKKRFFKQ